MLSQQNFLLLAALCYGLSSGASLVLWKKTWPVFTLLALALLANSLLLAMRYYQAWPMQPMYLNAQAIPLFLGLLSLLAAGNREAGERQKKLLCAALSGLSMLLMLLALLFPKDFYLPMLQSASPLAHAFHVCTIIGKAFFIFSALWAFVALADLRLDARRDALFSGRQSLLMAIWGFAFWCLAMFSGELWSFFGWGTPVVWDDAGITLSMAVWFFYTCLLHLRFSAFWNQKRCLLFSSLGALPVLMLSSLPDYGPFRPLF